MELRQPEDGPPLTAAAVIVAAGRSSRMGTDRSKALLAIDGRSVVERSVAAFIAAPSVSELVVVVRPEDRVEIERALRPHSSRVRALVPGGLERTDSVAAGVEAVSDEVDVILVHDAARCFVDPGDVERVARAAYVHGCALLATRVRDTLKFAPNGFLSEETAVREDFWTAQTPQGMRAARFRDVLARAQRDGLRPTDDAALHEHYHGPSKLVEGPPTNLKVTTPDDLPLAEALARALDERRTGTREQAG